MPRVFTVNDYRTQAGWRHRAIAIINEVIQANPTLALHSAALRHVINYAYPWTHEGRPVARRTCWNECINEVLVEREKLANWNRSAST